MMRRLGAIGSLLAAVLVVTVLGSWAAWAADGRPDLPKPKGEQCIDTVDNMRRGHFDMLEHQRSLTLRQGIRGAKVSLKECVACHAAEGADGKPIPVNAPGQFCQSCHAYGAVSIDCFECHATTPKGADASAQR